MSSSGKKSHCYFFCHLNMIWERHFPPLLPASFYVLCNVNILTSIWKLFLSPRPSLSHLPQKQHLHLGSVCLFNLRKSKTSSDDHKSRNNCLPQDHGEHLFISPLRCFVISFSQIQKIMSKEITANRCKYCVNYTCTDLHQSPCATTKEEKENR